MISLASLSLSRYRFVLHHAKIIFVVVSGEAMARNALLVSPLMKQLRGQTRVKHHSHIYYTHLSTRIGASYIGANRFTHLYCCDGITDLVFPTLFEHLQNTVLLQ